MWFCDLWSLIQTLLLLRRLDRFLFLQELHPMGIAVSIFTLVIILIELFTGFAIVGWTGDNMVVQRQNAPGPYWFTIVLQLLIFAVLPILLQFAE